jgi:hypothetical protein
MATNEHVPERSCVGCRRRRPQTELVRCVLRADGSAHVSRTAAGRGAWICVPPDECFALAVRRRGFERAWRRPVPAGELERLRELLGMSTRRTGETKG